jgi:hypothetical protein
MHELYELKDRLMKELEEYGKQDLTAGSLEVVDKLSHSIKNICKIIESYEDEDGYSMRGRSYDDGTDGMSMRSSYRNSYARGRGSNVRRDSMGRYSRDDRYSYADGVEELVENVKGVMNDLPQNLKQDAQRFVQKLEQEMM